MTKILFLIALLMPVSQLCYAGGDLPFPLNFEQDSVEMARWVSDEYDLVVLLKQKEDLCGIFIKDETGLSFGGSMVTCGQDRIVQAVAVGAEEAIVNLPVKDKKADGLLELTEISIGLQRKN